MEAKKVYEFFCEDCGHYFEEEIVSCPDPNHVRCPVCRSEYVNHNLERSLFENLGMPELEKCDPDNCRACLFHCELFSDNKPEEE